MSNSQVRRWFAAGITGTLFAMLMLALAAPVAADGGLVTQPAGQGGNSIVYVSSPGFVNNGTAVNPITNGGNFCTDPSCGVLTNGQPVTFVNGQPVVYVNGQPFFVSNGQPAFVGNGFSCSINGCGVPINYGGCTFSGCAGQFIGNCAAGGCGTLGYTAAGPIVGVDNNGNPIVYDVRGGTFDTYTRGPNGVVCEADSNGNCQKGSPGNP